MLKNKNYLLIGLVVILALVLLAVLFKDKLTSSKAKYSVVYLSTGEVYVGTLKTFPDLELTDSYILQVTKDATDATKNNFQLNPIKDALWAPEALHLVKDNVIFYGPLDPESKIAQTLVAQSK